jgi:AcrR family transcriptional regulator
MLVRPSRCVADAPAVGSAAGIFPARYVYQVVRVRVKAEVGFVPSSCFASGRPGRQCGRPVLGSPVICRRNACSSGPAGLLRRAAASGHGPGSLTWTNVWFRYRGVYCARGRPSIGPSLRGARRARLTGMSDHVSVSTERPGGQGRLGAGSASAERAALLAARIAEADEHGYSGTSVAGILARAGLSRKALYRHFDGKEACFLAAYDEVTDGSLRRMQSAFEDAAGGLEGAEAAISALLEVALEHPAGLRLGTIGIAALGADGIERRLAVSGRYEQFVTDVLHAALPEGGEVPRALARAVVGGVRRALYGRAGRADRDELLSLVPGLVAWAGCYFPTPKAIAAAPRNAGRAMPNLQGGRAPGTLAPHPVLLGRRGLPRGDQNTSHSFVVHIAPAVVCRRQSRRGIFRNQNIHGLLPRQGGSAGSGDSGWFGEHLCWRAERAPCMP